jgi:hypothetical protein
MRYSRRSSVVRGFELGITLFLALALSGTAAAAAARKMRLAYTGWDVGTAVSYVGVDCGVFKNTGVVRG